MKTKFFIVAIMATTAVSCSKALEINTELGQIRTITASFSQPQDESGAAKASFIGASSLGWSNGDVIFVSTPTKIGTGNIATTYSEFTTHASDGAQLAAFEWSGGDALVPDSHYAIMYTSPVSNTKGYNSTKPDGSTSSIYLGKAFTNTPANYLVAFVPCEQTYVPGGLAPYSMPMYGYCTDLSDITMTCLGSVLRFNLYSTTGTKTVKSISLRGMSSTSSAVPIAGAYGISRSEDGRLMYTAEPCDVDGYYGPWNISSTTCLAADMIKYECNDAAVSTDSSTPTEFNVVFASPHKTLKAIELKVELTTGEVYTTTLEKNFLNNTVYSLQAKDIDSF